MKLILAAVFLCLLPVLPAGAGFVEGVAAEQAGVTLRGEAAP